LRYHPPIEDNSQSGEELTMFQSISNTWSIMGASWRTLRQDKELLMFPLASGIACALVLASFILPMAFTGWLTGPEAEQATTGEQVAYYAVLFLFYFCNYFVITFFNVGIVACAVKRMSGENPTVGDGLRAATQRLPQIFGWSLLAATVGLILRIIEDRSEKVGRIVAGILGVAWTMVSYLVVPVMVVKGKGPFGALKDSAHLLKETWGEQITAGFSFAVLFFLLGIPGYVLLIVGIVGMGAVGQVVGIGLIAAGVLYLVVMALVQSALKVIFQTALYLYASQGRVPGGFNERMLSGAVQQRN
jgi:hypothetical protein